MLHVCQLQQNHLLILRCKLLDLHKLLMMMASDKFLFMQTYHKEDMDIVCIGSDAENF